MNAGRGKLLCAAILIAAAIAGCYRKVYIYEYADGRRIESNFPLNQNPRIEVSDLRADAGGDANEFTGQWRGENLEAARDDRSILLQTVTEDGRHRSGRSVSSREMIGSPTGAAFELKREAGTLKFDRTTDAGGRVTLTMDPAYVATIADATGQSPTAEQKLKLFQSGTGLAYVRALKDAGYQFTLDELLELRNSGVSAEYIVVLKKAGYDFKPAQMVNLSRNGIGRDFAVSLRESGFLLNDEQIIKLSHNGIGRDYARDMKAAGCGNIDDILELSRKGISRTYAQQMGLGGKRSVKALVELNRNGVSPSFGESFAKLGYEFADDDLIKLGRNGVSPSFAKSILEAGYKFSANDLIELGRNGVSSDYARKVKQAGYHLTAAQLVTLSHNGVSSSFIASLHDPNKPNLSVDAIVDLSRKGVNAATVKRIRGM